MAYDAITASLMGVELFQGLSAAQIAALARIAERMVYHPGAIIIENRADGDAAYVLVAGEAVRLSSPGEPRSVETVPPGSVIGEMAMLVEVEHTSTVAALSRVRALRIPRSGMIELMLADPTLADHLVARIASRLHGVLSELAEVNEMTQPGVRGHAGDPPAAGAALH
jgi:CRP-like cAMP-binding protein